MIPESDIQRLKTVVSRKRKIKFNKRIRLRYREPIMIMKEISISVVFFCCYFAIATLARLLGLGLGLGPGPLLWLLTESFARSFIWTLLLLLIY